MSNYTGDSCQPFLLRLNERPISGLSSEGTVSRLLLVYHWMGSPLIYFLHCLDRSLIWKAEKCVIFGRKIFITSIKLNNKKINKKDLWCNQCILLLNSLVAYFLYLFIFCIFLQKCFSLLPVFQFKLTCMLTYGNSYLYYVSRLVALVSRLVAK